MEIITFIGLILIVSSFFLVAYASITNYKAVKKLDKTHHQEF